jgi:cell division protease FtsH
MAQRVDDRAAETPPPGARGSSPTPPQFPRFRFSPRWIVFLALLALNLFIASRAMEPESRVRVPYSPFFLQQVQARNVEEITSKGTDIQG